MENTGKVLVGSGSESSGSEEATTPQWYIALGERWIGPLTAADVYDRVLSQEISWAHFVWRQGQPDWKRICDTPAFQAAVPNQPASNIQSEVKKAAAPAAAATKSPPVPPSPERASRIWFLFYNESQFGPFTDEEVRRFLQVGKIHGRVHAWKDGMEGWVRLEKIEGFEGDVAISARVREAKSAAASPKVSSAAAQAASQQSSSQAPVKRKEQRHSPRRPLVARMIFAKDEEVAVGICRDISIGGMQVLTDRVPAAPGARIKMNVSPAGENKMKPFVASGVIVRLLEDGRGFSFRFENLPGESRNTIEEYIRSEEQAG